MDTISRVEKGDFSARSYTEEKIPKEFTRIGRGFNEMVVHIENLIEQVKQALCRAAHGGTFGIGGSDRSPFLI